MPTGKPKTLGEAIPELRRPFTAAAVKVKIQASWPKDQPTSSLLVYYIDARLASERLNAVCADAWEELPPTFMSTGVLWGLRVFGVTRYDFGTVGSATKENAAKATVSDGLKRTAVKFGVGVSIYAVPKLTVPIGTSRGGKPLVVISGGKPKLTPDGEEAARKHYQAWLDTIGKDAFGDPLDHGDALEAQGDVDVDDPADTHTAATDEVAAAQAEAAAASTNGRRRADAAQPVPAAAPAAPAEDGTVDANRFRKAFALARKVALVEDAGDGHQAMRDLAAWMTSKDTAPHHPVARLRDLDDHQVTRLETMLDALGKDAAMAAEVAAKVEAFVASRTAAATTDAIPGV